MGMHEALATVGDGCLGLVSDPDQNGTWTANLLNGEHLDFEAAAEKTPNATGWYWAQRDAAGRVLANGHRADDKAMARLVYNTLDWHGRIWHG